MPVSRLLQILAMMLLLPSGLAAAQEDAAESPATTPAAESEAPSAPQPESGDGEDGSGGGEASPEPATPAPASETAEDAETGDQPAEPPATETPAAEGSDAADSDAEEPDAEKSKADDAADADSAAEAEAPAPEPRRLTGLGSVDGPRLPNQPWRVHDLFRPQPPVVAPADVDVTLPPPSDAMVLFDGTDLSYWGHRDPEKPGVFIEPQWKLENGYFEATRGHGDLFTLDSFGSVQLHLEWATPAEPRGNSQGRGNSGVKFLGLYEVQILDSYNNRTYADGQAAAIYGQYPPVVNVSRPPGKWQSYDIIFEIPLFDGEDLVRPGYLTVLHNGVLVHHRRELAGVTGMRSPGEYDPHPPAGPIMLQDHGNPIRFRNVWVRRLD